MNIKAKLVRASLGFLLLFFAGVASAQDVRVNCSQNPTCTLTPAGGISWASGNLTFVFKPLNPRVSVYVFIHNLNTTSAHTSQTVQVFQSPFSQDAAPSLSNNSSSWTQDTLIQNGTPGASCANVNAKVENSPGASGLGTCYVTTMFAAQVAIKITGAAAASGSPDNFELAIVQETGAPQAQQPGGSAGTLASPNSGSSSTSPLQTVSDLFAQSYTATSATITNPVITSDVLMINPNAGARTLYLDRIVFTASAAATVTLQTTTTVGSTCSSITPVNLKTAGGGASTATTQSACASHGAGSTVGFYAIPAGQSVTFDLRGFVLPAGSSNGLDALMTAALTGTISAELFWYEK